MQPNQQPPQDWQQPPEVTPQAPYQAPTQEVLEPEVPENTPVQPRATTNEAPAYDELIEQSPIAESPLESDDDVLLRWEGTEYLHRERSMLWYIALGIATLVLVLVAIFLLRSVTFAILIPVMMAALVVYVRRAPEILRYTLSRKGLHVNDKLYPYDRFKSFGVVAHGANHSVVLVPRKRFEISQTLYFPEEIGESLVDMLAARLPMKELQPDVVDRLLARLHL